MAKERAYFGLDYIVSLILAIIPFTSWICGAITRIQRGEVVFGILQLIPITIPFFWIVDLVSMILNKDLKYLA